MHSSGSEHLEAVINEASKGSLRIRHLCCKLFQEKTMLGLRKDGIWWTAIMTGKGSSVVQSHVWIPTRDIEALIGESLPQSQGKVR